MPVKTMEQVMITGSKMIRELVSFATETAQIGEVQQAAKCLRDKSNTQVLREIKS